MAYLTAPEKGIPVAVTKKGQGKFPPGTHKCRIVTIVKEPTGTMVALFHPTHGLHTETITEGWPEAAERGEEVVAFIALSAGLIAERHPALPSYRLLDALTREAVTEYSEDVAELLRGRVLAGPILSEVTYDSRVYKITPLIKVGK